MVRNPLSHVSFEFKLSLFTPPKTNMDTQYYAIFEAGDTF